MGRKFITAMVGIQGTRLPQPADEFPPAGISEVGLGIKYSFAGIVSLLMIHLDG